MERKNLGKVSLKYFEHFFRKNTQNTEGPPFYFIF
jgi:hypothetical protein